MSSGTHIRRCWCAIALCSIADGEVWSTTASAGVYQDVNDSWNRFGAVYSRVLEHYYQDLDHGELMRAAIDGGATRDNIVSRVDTSDLDWPFRPTALQAFYDEVVAVQ